MSIPSQEQLQALLQTVNDGIDALYESENAGEAYAALYPADVTEGDLARFALQHPPLRPLVEKVAYKIIALSRRRALWMNETEQGGGAFTQEMALYDKQYCALFAECLLHQDLTHEVDQTEYTLDILHKWGLCYETGLILSARCDNPGQNEWEIYEDLRERYGEALDEYLVPVDEDMLEFITPSVEQDDEDEDLDEEDFDEEEEEEDGGCRLQIQNKRSLESLTLEWQEDFPYLLISYNLRDTKVLKYPSFAALKKAVEGVEADCEAHGCACQKEVCSSSVPNLIEYGNPKKEKPLDIFSLFTPEGEPTAEDLLAAKYLKGFKTIPCKKVQLFKAVDECAVFLADPASCRILYPAGFTGQYLWEYATVEEMLQGLAEIIQGYEAKGYERVFEETIEFAFARSLDMTRQAAESMVP